MPAARYFSPIDTLNQKLQIERRLGSVKACKYFSLLTRFLSLKISKPEFDKLCLATIGRDNVHLHNHFLRSILKKASLSKIPPSRIGKEVTSLSIETPNGYQRSNLQLICRDFPQSPRKGRTPNLRDRRFTDRSGLLGDHGKNHNIRCKESALKIHEQQSITNLHSVSSKPPLSVEDGEGFDQDSGSPRIYSSSPVRAPLGIPTNIKGTRKIFGKESASVSVTTTCQNIGQLPDTNSLLKWLEQKLEIEGFKISVDSANLLNNALDGYLKRLIKPCLDLVVSKSLDEFNGATPIQPGLNGLPMSRNLQNPSAPVFASISDFQAAVEINPVILGEDWPLHFQKLWLRASEE